jgi:hypothetical protein
MLLHIYVALFLFNMGKYILILKKWLVLMYSCLAEKSLGISASENASL